jgi:hypothetical protein
MTNPEIDTLSFSFGGARIACRKLAKGAFVARGTLARRRGFNCRSGWQKERKFRPDEADGAEVTDRSVRR